MKRKPKPATYEEARMAMAEAQVAAIMYRQTPAEERFCYLTEPVDQPTPKIPFAVGLHQITGIQNPKRALANFQEFLIAEHFSQQEVDLFMESRADRMPPILSRWGWNFGGFLQSEVPTLKALFAKWRGDKRLENLCKGKKNRARVKKVA